MLTEEQYYWSLNGNFGALHRMSKMISEGKVTSFETLKEHILIEMKIVNELMGKTEDQDMIRKEGE